MAAKPMTKVGTAADLLKGRPPEVRQWTITLRRLVRAAVPGVSERVYLGWRVIAFSRGQITTGKSAQMSKMFCGLAPLKDSVGLYFHRGAKLPDPEGLLEGAGKGMRHVKIRSAKDIRPAAIKKLVRAAHQLAGGSWRRG